MDPIEDPAGRAGRTGPGIDLPALTPEASPRTRIARFLIETGLPFVVIRNLDGADQVILNHDFDRQPIPEAGRGSGIGPIRECSVDQTFLKNGGLDHDRRLGNGRGLPGFPYNG